MYPQGQWLTPCGFSSGDCMKDFMLKRATGLVNLTELVRAVVASIRLNLHAGQEGVVTSFRPVIVPPLCQGTHWCTGSCPQDGGRVPHRLQISIETQHGPGANS